MQHLSIEKAQLLLKKYRTARTRLKFVKRYIMYYIIISNEFTV